MTIAASLFDAVNEYVDQWPSLSDRNKKLRRTHPLVVFAETALEQWSTTVLNRRLVGLNESTKSELLTSREALRDAGGGAGSTLEILLFAFEQLCEFLPASNYTGDEDDVVRFHEELFPSLLDAIADWADVNDAALASVARPTHGNYVSTIGWSG